MTASSAARPGVEEMSVLRGPAPDGRYPTRPAEGWLSVLMLGVMLAVIALAVDDARWAGTVGPGKGSQTDFLLWATLAAAALGFGLAKVRWPVLAAHVLSALVGAVFVILAVAGVVSQSPVVSVRLADLDNSLLIFLTDVLVRGVRSDQTSAFLLLVGVVAWASGYFAAYAVFRHRRPMSAVILLGLLLLTNVSATMRPQYAYVVLFCAAALVLLVRFSLSEQRLVWGWGTPETSRAAGSLYLRNGFLFVTLSLAGALVLTSTASSAPLRPAFLGLESQMFQVGSQLQTLTGGLSGSSRLPAGLFASSATITGVWSSSNELIYTVRSSDGQPHYWVAAAYDSFDGHTWHQTSPKKSSPIATGTPMLADSVDQVTPGPTHRSITVTVTADELTGGTLISPATPLSATKQVNVVTTGSGGPLGSVQLTNGLDAGESYTVAALVRRSGLAGGITGNALAAAGTVYPDWVRPYIQIQAGSVGPIVQKTADGIVAKLPADQRDPYHIAQAIQNYLNGFTYDTNVQSICGPRTLVADCLLEHRQGYCEYFATTMVMMLRSEQIPARYMMGYLPGLPTTEPGTFDVERAAAHAWVEVYFPKYGWVRFDPTPPGNAANGQAATELPPGPPVPTPTPGPSPAAHPSPSFVAGNDLGGDIKPQRPGTPSGGRSGSEPPLPLLLGGGLLALAVLLLGWVRLRRNPVPSPEAGFSAIARLAARLGVRQRPAQTTYEYAGVLADLLPGVRPELEVVARSRVEAAYAKRPPAGVRLLAFSRAYHRVRRNLFWLLLPWRRRGPRRR